MSRTDHLLVLTYHAIDERASILATAPGRFRRQLDLLSERGLTGVSLAEAFALRDGNSGFEDTHVVLTFDDGYLSVLENAVTSMMEHGFTATIFLASGLVGLTRAGLRDRHSDLDGDLLSWGQAAELLKAGWQIGSHTVTHPDLRRLDANTLHRELSQSRSKLEQGLQTHVDALAYPYGRVDANVREAASRYYRLACTTRLARHRLTGDSLCIDRIDMYYMQDLNRFARLLDGRLDGWLCLRRGLRAVRRLAS